MRINGFISATGLCSRREADQLITDGKVTVNGILATMGQQVSESDVILVRGEPLTQKQKSVYILLNKPVGITCTTERNIPKNKPIPLPHEPALLPPNFLVPQIGTK